MYPTVFLSVLLLDEHLPRLVENSGRIRLVFYTIAHDQACFDTYPVMEMLEQDNLQHRQPAISEPCATSLDVSEYSTVPLRSPACGSSPYAGSARHANSGPRSRRHI